MKWQSIAAGGTGPTFERVYNLFRNRKARDLCCAAPEDRPVPAFLDGEAWEYAGTLRESDAPLLGFDRTAAELGARLNGFHLFQLARSNNDGRTVTAGCREVIYFSALRPGRMDSELRSVGRKESYRLLASARDPRRASTCGVLSGEPGGRPMR